MLTVGSLFSGIGGIDKGLEDTGRFQVRFQVEIDPWCRRVLAKHWPQVTRYEDVRTFLDDDPEPVDCLVGGFPCQPISSAGKQRGKEDPRWLWPAFARAIRDLRPRYVLMENVPNLTHIGLDAVLGDLAACGYDAEWDCFPAAAVGAPHLRYRLFIVAYAANFAGDRWGTWRAGRPAASRERAPIPIGALQVAADPDRQSLAVREEPLVLVQQPSPERGHGWTTEPGMVPLVHGLPERVDQIRGLGNAVVPQVVTYLGHLIADAVDAGRI